MTCEGTGACNQGRHPGRCDCRKLDDDYVHIEREAWITLAICLILAVGFGLTIGSAIYAVAVWAFT